MEKHSCGNTVFGPGFGRPHDDKRGNGRTAAHPQRDDEEDEFASGRREARDIKDSENMRKRARAIRESFEHDSKEDAASRTSRSIRAERV